MSKGSSRKRKQREMGNTVAEKIIRAEDFQVVKKDILQDVQLFMSRVSTNKFQSRYPL